MGMRRKGVIAILAAVLVTGVVAAVWLGAEAGKDDGTLSTSGTIEATEIPVAAEVAGKVVRVEAEEGRRVAAGDVLVRLETTALAIQLEQAQAALKLAEARLAEARVGPRPSQVRQAEELARQAAAALDGAQKNYATVKKLFDQGVAPRTQLDAATTQLHTAEAQAEAARAQAEVVRQGATREQRQQLEAAVAQAQAAVELARFNLDRTEVKAPVGGVVVRRLIEPGALVAPGATLVTLADLDDLWLKVYVPENQLNQVKLGMRVGVQVDAYPHRQFMAQVVQINDRAEFTPRNVQTKKERATTVYAVKLRLLEGLAGELKPGMPADVTFAAGQRK
ncbi:MAG TPA: HlyD family efflux transporter periplasmic adaptor subunit [Firmicutes bacterium]|nr:HlyD family efflux transporter periplasmic adaptor subunit [Bacillota bacterium]